MGRDIGGRNRKKCVKSVKGIWWNTKNILVEDCTEVERINASVEEIVEGMAKKGKKVEKGEERNTGRYTKD